MTNEDPSLTANENNSEHESETPKKEWQPMRLKYSGEAKDVVRTGGGKFSPSPADPGDVRKPPGQS